MNVQSYRDVRAEKLSTTETEKVRWRELLEDLERDQERLSDPEKIVTEYFGVEATRSQYIPKSKGFPECPFRKSLKAFRALYAHDHPEKGDDSCDLLISIVGFSLEPIMHTVLTLRPKNLLFIFSPESALLQSRMPAIDRLRSLISFHGEGYQPIITDKILENTDTPRVFSDVYNAINQGSSCGVVAIDVTGGKKSMDSSAFLAASLFEMVSIYYVDYDKYNRDKGYPVWGSEFLNELNNPYKMFGVREEHLIKEFWDRGDFAAVIQFIESWKNELTPEIAKRYLLTEKRDRLVDISMAAACYDAWSRFEYAIAVDKKFKVYHDCHIDALEDLRMCSTVFEMKSIVTQKNAELALELAVDRYVRGDDASKHKEWNRSALCYAQSVELLLRFCFLRDRGAFKSKEKNIEKLTLGRLKGLVFDDNPEYFSDSSLGEKIIVHIADERNALSHFQCFSSDQMDYNGVMAAMKSCVDELFVIFANKFKIADGVIQRLKQNFAFCSIRNDLQLFKP